MQESQDYFKALILQNLAQAAGAGVTTGLEGLTNLASMFLMRSFEKAGKKKSDNLREQQLEELRKQREAQKQREIEEKRRIKMLELEKQQKLQQEKERVQTMVRNLKNFVVSNRQRGNKEPLLSNNNMIANIIDDYPLTSEQQQQVKEILNLETQSNGNFVTVGRHNFDVSGLEKLINANKGTRPINLNLPNINKNIANNLSIAQKHKYLAKKFLEPNARIDSREINDFKSNFDQNLPNKMNPKEVEKLKDKFTKNLDLEGIINDKKGGSFNDQNTLELFENYQKYNKEQLVSNLTNSLLMNGNTENKDNILTLKSKYFSKKYDSDVLQKIETIKYDALNEFRNSFKTLRKEWTQNRNEKPNFHTVANSEKIYSLMKDMTNKIDQYSTKVRKDFVENFKQENERFKDLQNDGDFLIDVLSEISPEFSNSFKNLDKDITNEFLGILNSSKRGNLDDLITDLANASIKNSLVDEDKINLKDNNNTSKIERSFLEQLENDPDSFAKDYSNDLTLDDNASQLTKKSPVKDEISNLLYNEEDNNGKKNIVFRTGADELVKNFIDIQRRTFKDDEDMYLNYNENKPADVSFNGKHYVASDRINQIYNDYLNKDGEKLIKHAEVYNRPEIIEEYNYVQKIAELKDKIILYNEKTGGSKNLKEYYQNVEKNKGLEQDINKKINDLQDKNYKYYDSYSSNYDQKTNRNINPTEKETKLFSEVKDHKYKVVSPIAADKMIKDDPTDNGLRLFALSNQDYATDAKLIQEQRLKAEERNRLAEEMERMQKASEEEQKLANRRFNLFKPSTWSPSQNQNELTEDQGELIENQGELTEKQIRKSESKENRTLKKVIKKAEKFDKTHKQLVINKTKLSLIKKDNSYLESLDNEEDKALARKYIEDIKANKLDNNE